MVRQEGVLNIIDWFAGQLQIGPGKKVLGLTTVCFDISVLEIFMPLLHGAELVFAFSETQKDPFRILEIVKDMRLDVLQATPTTFEMMLATGWSGDSDLDLLVGGEAFRPSLLQMVSKSRSVRNVYGPTETTIWSSSYTLPRDIASTTHAVSPPPPISIGEPISATQFYLASEVDPLKLSDTDEGELCIGGIGVARGYLHANDITVGRFISTPYDVYGNKIYRTGDIVKREMSSNGSFNYAFVRRMDDQVKINGFRIELAEIEQVFQLQDGVEQAVALVRNNVLLLYLKASQGHSLDQAERRLVLDGAKKKLTHYMIPSEIVVVQDFPHTANGKLDRKALPDPPSQGSHEKAIPLSGALALKKTDTMLDHVLSVFHAVRGTTASASASFSALGVDSLGAIFFIKSLNQSIGGKITVKPSDVFGANISMASFSEELYRKLAASDPGTLARLGIRSGSSPSEMDLNENLDISQVASGKFDELMSTNVKLFEGIRGWLTAMVLYDHFHNPITENYSLGVSSDIHLFIILTGFTTAIQLRENIPPLTQSDLPRPPFQWQRFLFTRFAGLFPVMWFALLLSAPRWVVQNNAGGVQVEQRRRLSIPEHQSGLCTFLYVTALETWASRECMVVGPSDLAYTCIIWSCFVMYCFGRLALRLVEDFFLARSARRVSGMHENINIRGIRSPAGEIYDGELRTIELIETQVPNEVSIGIDSTGSPPSIDDMSWICRAIHRRLPRTSARVVALSLFTLHFGVFVWYWLGSSQSKVPTNFIAFFTAGHAAALVLENAHWCAHLQFAGKLPEAGGGTRLFVQRLGPDLILLGLILLCVPFPVTRAQPGETQNGSAHQISFGNFIKWAGMPALFVAFLVPLCLQEPGNGRKNLSRFIIDNPIARMLGYASYTSCKHPPL